MGTLDLLPHPQSELYAGFGERGYKLPPLPTDPPRRLTVDEVLAELLLILLLLVWLTPPLTPYNPLV